MGTICKNSLQDLKVTYHHSSLVFPSNPQKTQTNRSQFLSNIDQVLNFNVQTIHFFSANPNYPPPHVTRIIRTALADLLVHYDFMAGRFHTNPLDQRLEILCNSTGAGFVEASSEFKLHQLGDLVYPNPAFSQLSVTSLASTPLDQDQDQPLCIFQVTAFECGGFSIGFCCNHATLDGLAAKIFLQNLASLAGAAKTIAITPCNDRRLLAARSPPRVTFPHPELGTHNIFEITPEDLDFRVINLSAEQISRLKKINQNRFSSFNSIAAHIWCCKALSEDNDNNDDAVFTMLYAVDIRGRMKPPFSEGYAGNAVVSGYASARIGELRVGGIAKLVAEGTTRVTDEYVRSVVDWGEVNKGGFPHGDFLLSSWWRIGFGEVEYPWGKPRFSCPVVCRRKDVVLLFPDAEGDGGGGVNVLVSLPRNEMEKFVRLFHQFL